MTEGVYHYPLTEPFLKELINRDSRLYRSMQIQFSYHSNAMEGSAVSLPETEDLFRERFNHQSKTRDEQETINHFHLFDEMLKTYNEPLSEGLLLHYHRILKDGEDIAGKYKTYENVIGSLETASVKEAPVLARALLNQWEQKEEHSFEDIVTFHVELESIHPFQDGNGRVGRMIMFKESLRSNITPWILYMSTKQFYLHGFRQWRNNHNKIPMYQYMNQCEEYIFEASKTLIYF